MENSQMKTKKLSRGHLIIREELPAEQMALLMSSINRLTRVQLRADQVYIRSMYLCSNRLCHQDWGRFSKEALEQVCKLIVGQSVMVGHDRTKLPIARFCHAEVVRREDDLVDEQGQDVYWVRAWFYWLRETSGARDLQLNIDGGIYREVSISWRYRHATCSICGKRIEECVHVPGKLYEGKRCFFYIHEIAEVLEGSIVYKGAESKTRFEGGQRERGASSDNQETFVQKKFLRKTIAQTIGRFERLPRWMCSMLIVTDRSESMIPVVLVAKEIGIRVKVLDLSNRGIVRGGIGGYDLIAESSEVIAGEVWDSIWVRAGEEALLNRFWWKALCRQARLCCWETDNDGNSEQIRSRLIGGLFPCPPWQLNCPSYSQDEGFHILVREEI